VTKYTKDYLRVSQTVFGQGAISPGGLEELKEILSGVDLAGKSVVDIGCGLGGFTVMLAAEFAASVVEGHDVVPLLVEEAVKLVNARKLEENVECKLVPADGSIASPDQRFDIVFSKDSIIHIPNRGEFYKEVFRVLKPGGMFVASDWLRTEGIESEKMQVWRKESGQPAPMATLPETEMFLTAAGFGSCEFRDRNNWYASHIPTELAAVEKALAEEPMSDYVRNLFEERLVASNLKFDLVKSGEHRPTHVRATKPH
jgi:SAM-dependent methyltransferase